MNITKILKNIAKMYEVLYNRGYEDCKENTKKFRIGGIMNKFGKTLLTSLLVSSLTVSSVFAAPSVDDLKQNKEAAEKKVETLQDEMASLMAEINTLEEELVQTGKEIIKATDDLQKAEEKEKTQYEEMKARIKIMYENGTGSMLTKVFESGSIAEMLKKAEYVQAVHDKDRKCLEDYVETKEKIADLKESLEEDQKEQQKKQKEFESQKETLNATIEEAKAEVDDFDAQIQEAAQKAEQDRQRALAASSGNRGNSGTTSNGGGSDYVPPSNSGGGQAIVDAAYSFIGVPYVWGGESYSGVDCSGLVLMAHKAIGVSLPHSSGSQGSGGKAVANMAAALPGDVVCYSGHVGIYIGGGQMIHAPDFGQTVKVSSVYGSPWFRRYW